MEKQQPARLWRTAAGIALIVIPLAIVATKLLDGSQLTAIRTSLEPLPKAARKHAEYLLFVPLSTALVAFFRLSFGIRVLSVFRPALIAIAFQRTGLPLGLTFLALALTTVAALQTLLKGRDYYERVPMIVVLVVILMTASLVGFEHLHDGWMMRLAYFPVIALCLTCESFASTLSKSGLAEALWRAITTTALGALLMAITRIPGLMAALVRYPELLFVEAGFVLVVAEQLNCRLLEGFNPLSASLDRGRRPAASTPQIPLMEMNQ